MEVCAVASVLEDSTAPIVLRAERVLEVWVVLAGVGAPVVASSEAVPRASGPASAAEPGWVEWGVALACTPAAVESPARAPGADAPAAALPDVGAAVGALALCACAVGICAADWGAVTLGWAAATTVALVCVGGCAVAVSRATAFEPVSAVARGESPADRSAVATEAAEACSTAVAFDPAAAPGVTSASAEFVDGCPAIAPEAVEPPTARLGGEVRAS